LLIVAIAGIFVEEFITYTSRNRIHPIGIKFIDASQTLSIYKFINIKRRLFYCNANIQFSNKSTDPLK
jgi:hypothetical protein